MWLPAQSSFPPVWPSFSLLYDTASSVAFRSQTASDIQGQINLFHLIGEFYTILMIISLHAVSKSTAFKAEPKPFNVHTKLSFDTI